jgi:hypothetical protein
MKQPLLFQLSLVFLFVTSPIYAASPNVPDLFVGPFSHWIDVKADFGAIGDGIADDTVALQKAFAEVQKTQGFKTIYLPAGIYRVKDTLKMNAAGNLRIVGESPEQVILKWDGPTGKDLLFFDGVRYVHFSRVTLDGAAKAGAGLHVGIDYGNKGNLFPTGWGVYDIQFKNLTMGVKAGSPNCQSEATYERCLFQNCGVGISLMDANTANIWIRHSLFEKCDTGVTGSNHATILNCIFRGSRIVDIGGGELGYFAIRNCYSIGSRRFFENTDNLDGRPAVLQGNRVIDPTDPRPILLTGAGPFTVFDNVIRSPVGAIAPAIERGAKNNTAALFLGNTFTVGPPEAAIRAHAVGSTGRIIDTRVVDYAEVNATIPELPKAPVRIAADSKNVYQPSAMTGPAIQAAIDQAVASYKDASAINEPLVVYLKAGEYLLDSTLVIPPGVPLHITGDATGWGGPVKFKWFGAINQPMIRFTGPGNRATLENVFLQGEGKAAGIAIEKADQKGGRVLLERVISDIFTLPVPEVGVLVNGLDWTRIESFGAAIAAVFRVIGGPITKAGEPTTGGMIGWNSFYGGGGSATRPILDVDQGGKLLLADVWFENGGWPHRQPILDLGENKSGTVTLQGFKMQHHSKGVGPSTNLRVNGFTGKLTIFNLLLQNVVVEVGGKNPKQDILFATNTWGWGDPNGKVPAANSNMTIDATFLGKIAVVNCSQHYADWNTKPGRNVHAHTYPYQYETKQPADDWVREMMAHAREHQPEFGLSSVPTGATDVRLRWITADRLVGTGIRIDAN